MIGLPWELLPSHVAQIPKAARRLAFTRTGEDAGPNQPAGLLAGLAARKTSGDVEALSGRPFLYSAGPYGVSTNEEKGRRPKPTPLSGYTDFLLWCGARCRLWWSSRCGSRRRAFLCSFILARSALFFFGVPSAFGFCLALNLSETFAGRRFFGLLRSLVATT